MNFIPPARALVPLAAGDLGGGRAAGDQHAPLPRRHLLVRVEGEGGGIAPGAGVRHRPRRPCRGPERRPRRFRDRASAAVASMACMSAGKPKMCTGSRPAVAGPTADSIRGGIDGERRRVDVAEHRLGALEEEAVGGRDEAERRRQDLVARPPSLLPERQGAGPSCRSRPRRPVRRARRSVPPGPPRSAAASDPARAFRSGSPRGRAPPPARRAPAWRAGSARSLTAAPGPAGTRTRASRRAPPRTPRSRSPKRRASSMPGFRRRSRGAPGSPRRCRGARRGSSP